MRLYIAMHHILLHSNKQEQNSAIHRLASSCSFIMPDLLQAIAKSDGIDNRNQVRFWAHESVVLPSEIKNIQRIGHNTPLNISSTGHSGEKIIIANARYVADINFKLLDAIFAKADADILAIEIDSELCGFRENIRFDSQGNIVGLRRVFSDSIIPSSMPNDWPELVFISKKTLEHHPEIGTIPENFSDFIHLCNRHSLTSRSLRMAGISRDLYDTGELLDYLEKCLTVKTIATRQPASISDTAILKGKILAGKNVRIGHNVILAGPCILGNNVDIGDNTTIRNSIIADNTKLNGVRVEHAFCTSNETIRGAYRPRIEIQDQLFRSWPRYSYAGLWKRLIDIIFASFILLMSLPVFAIVAIAIKYSSPGPVFFKHKRQGLHGKDFHCIKFRTMIVGADDIQNQLRKINEVDGPQFKMDDDPRVNAIGKFLRDTCIDEIPQFINVLKGEMSVIGPRPSPEKENTFCAYWRDARLSVRPGITGLWQVMRTRKEGQDFQEWVIHDTTYVKNVSLIGDIKICLMTVRHIFRSILEQF